MSVKVTKAVPMGSRVIVVETEGKTIKEVADFMEREGILVAKAQEVTDIIKPERRGNADSIHKIIATPRDDAVVMIKAYDGSPFGLDNKRALYAFCRKGEGGKEEATWSYSVITFIEQ